MELLSMLSLDRLSDPVVLLVVLGVTAVFASGLAARVIDAVDDRIPSRSERRDDPAGGWRRARPVRRGSRA